MSLRCDFSDLPAEQCACTHCKPDEPAYADVTIAYRFVAQFDSIADCGHGVTEGDNIARTTDFDVICHNCSTEVRITPCKTD